MRPMETDAQRALVASVGGALLELRKRAGLSQREAAKLADSTQARLSDLEAGKAPFLITTLQHWGYVYGYEVEISFVPIEEEEDENA